MPLPQHDNASPNNVMVARFESVVQGRNCARTDVQRELLEACKDGSAVQRLLVYLSVTKEIKLMEIIGEIKQIDGDLARSLRRQESERYQTQKKGAANLLPVFSA